MYSLLIKNAKVIDGTGQKPQILDVAVEGDKIVNLSPNISVKAQVIVDATGKTLVPGFIDLQNHSDSYWQLFDNPSLDSLITQGFTSILVGNCGASLAPLLSKDALLSIQKWHNLEGSNINWQSFAEYLGALSSQRFACNIASLVGYSTLRRGVVGDQIRRLETEELDILKRALKTSLDDGAFGLSSGLSYSHEIIISELELFELAKIVKDSDSLFAVHLRSEGEELIEALAETLDVARNSGVNMKISHFKVRNENNWNKLPEALELIETAFHKGTNVHFDVYPYDTIWQPLYAYLPKWAIQGGRTMMLKHLADPTYRNKILMYLSSTNVRYPDLFVASTANKLNFIGKSLGQIAKNLEMSSEQALLHVIENGGSEVLVFEKNLDPQQVETLSLHPLSFIASDGAGFGLVSKNRLVHPRCFGTAAKFLRSAGDQAVNLETAIKKLTFGPAKKAGFEKRGEIKIGNFADLVILNESQIKDLASYENPYIFSQGVEQVYVNGRAVVLNGNVTGQLPGYVLKKS